MLSPASIERPPFRLLPVQFLVSERDEILAMNKIKNVGEQQNADRGSPGYEVMYDAESLPQPRPRRKSLGEMAVVRPRQARPTFHLITP